MVTVWHHGAMSSNAESIPRDECFYTHRKAMIDSILACLSIIPSVCLSFSLILNAILPPIHGEIEFRYLESCNLCCRIDVSLATVI